jgi:aryl-phospho-beta-D-glucosidase BglC (GH1 family)
MHGGMGLRVRQLLMPVLVFGALVVPAAPAARAATTVAVAQATSGTLDGWYMPKVQDAAASNGTAVKYEWPGTVRLTVTLPADADSVTLRVRGDQCGGAPAYTLTIDNALLASDAIASSSWANRTYSTPLLAGTHAVAVTYTNDHTEPWPNACDRNLYLDTVTFSDAAPLPVNPPIPAGFVHQAGTGLLDGANRPIRLHGVDLGGWLLWEGWIWGRGFDYIGESAMMRNLANLVGPTAAEQFRSDVRANYVTTSDFHAMSVDGFNVARVGFNYRLLEDDANPFVYKQSGWDVLDRVVSEAKQANVYLVLDMHAAPCSQMYAFVSDYVGGPFLWNSTQCQDRMVAMWKAIAAHYATENVIAGYDLLGETIIGNAQLLALYQRVTAAIRQVDRNHLIIYEGNNMARTFDMFTAPLDSNEMLSFHDYAWAFAGQDLSVRMVGYDAAAKRLNAPQYVGEFGESTYDDDQKYVTTFNADPLVAAWTEWTWKQAPGFPALQTIRHTAASQKLIDWIDDPTRPQPTPAEAAQGMSDFIRAIRFENTLPDATLRGILSSPAAPMPSSAGSMPAAQPAPPASKPAARPSTPAPKRRTVACTRSPRKTRTVRTPSSRTKRPSAAAKGRARKQPSRTQAAGKRRGAASQAGCRPRPTPRTTKKRPAPRRRARPPARRH